ncbi:MAG: hypothetical protein JWM32_3095 [Verrucomicrobia bacterium]|nr:hypothetical protein [Verrucomicrobiota bacterium]
MKIKKPLVNDADTEIAAISTVYSALKFLAKPAQIRVLEYVQQKLDLKVSISGSAQDGERHEESREQEKPARELDAVDETPSDTGSDADDWNSVSAVARRWVQRSGLDRQFLSTIFSIGGEEIDLIAKAIPGTSKRQRMREVILLKGIAAYLASGVARVSHEAAKEACSHYNAFDSANFARHLKGFASEIGGAKESGYTLTPRGLASGVEVITAMKGK